MCTQESVERTTSSQTRSNQRHDCAQYSVSDAHNPTPGQDERPYLGSTYSPSPANRGKTSGRANTATQRTYANAIHAALRASPSGLDSNGVIKWVEKKLPRAFPTRAKETVKAGIWAALSTQAQKQSPKIWRYRRTVGGSGYIWKYHDSVADAGKPGDLGSPIRQRSPGTNSRLESLPTSLEKSVTMSENAQASYSANGSGEKLLQHDRNHVLTDNLISPSSPHNAVFDANLWRGSDQHQNTTLPRRSPTAPEAGSGYINQPKTSAINLSSSQETSSCSSYENSLSNVG